MNGSSVNKPTINFCRPSPLMKVDAMPTKSPISVVQFERLQKTFFEFQTHACAQKFWQHPTDEKKSLVAVRWTPSYSREAEQMLRKQLKGTEPTIKTRLDKATGKVTTEKYSISCADAAGGDKTQAAAFCTSLSTYLEKITKESQPYKPYDPHDPSQSNPFKWAFWAKVIDGTLVGLGFAIGGGFVNWVVKKATGKSIVDRIKDVFRNGKGGGNGGGGGESGVDNNRPYYIVDKNGRPWSSTVNEMVSVGATLMAALAEASKRMRPPSVPADPVNMDPPLDTIDKTYIFNPLDPAIAAYEAGLALNLKTYQTHPLTARQLMWGTLGVLAAAAAAVAFVTPVDGPFGEAALAKASAACFAMAATSK